MIKWPVKYTDYNGKEREEELYFNLNETEVIELEVSVDGGLIEMINRISKAEKGSAIMSTLKTVILKSYGEKSADGKYFRKMDDEGRPLSRMFEQSEAFNALFVELVTDADKSAKFFNGVIPSKN